MASFTHFKTTHSYHIVDPSPWPILAAFGAFMLTTVLTLYMHKFFGGWNLLTIGFLLILYVMHTWWRDIIREATFEDTHSVVVQKGLRLGMILFIVSEVMFFFLPFFLPFFGRFLILVLHYVLCFYLFLYLLLFLQKFFVPINLYVFLRNKQIINNLGTICSALSLLPNSFGKISMFSWFVRQFKETSFFEYCLLSRFIMIILAILGFLLLFVIFKKDTFFVDKVIPYFKKLPLIRQFILGCFTLFFAIPNKFWINVNLHFISVFIISALVYLLGFIFPFLFFCYVMYLVLCLESLIFALLYEYSTFFKRATNYLLFGNTTESFADSYFKWFWGNMWRQATKKLPVIVTGGAAIEAQRQSENTKKNQYADKQTEKAGIETKEGFKTPEERAIYHTERRNEWVEENGTVTKVLKKGKEGIEKMGDW